MGESVCRPLARSDSRQVNNVHQWAGLPFNKWDGRLLALPCGSLYTYICVWGYNYSLFSVLLLDAGSPWWQLYVERYYDSSPLQSSIAQLQETIREWLCGPIPTCGLLTYKGGRALVVLDDWLPSRNLLLYSDSKIPNSDLWTVHVSGTIKQNFL